MEVKSVPGKSRTVVFVVLSAIFPVDRKGVVEWERKLYFMLFFVFTKEVQCSSLV